jgi:hypothetical protein
MNDNRKFSVSLLDPTGTILNELKHKEVTQRSVALTYYLAMISDYPTDWPKVNQAIIERWSTGGLERVKQMAHAHGKQLKETPCQTN